MGRLYRIRQFLLGFQTHNRPLPASTQVKINATLSPAERALFSRQALRDQWHSAAVMEKLIEAEHDAPPLLAAALLHDAGKCRAPVSQWDRIAPVLVEKSFPTLLARWGDAPPTGWRKPFVIRLKHPAWGAEMAADAGSHPQTIRLIRCHQDKDVAADDSWLTALQWADNQA